MQVEEGLGCHQLLVQLEGNEFATVSGSWSKVESHHKISQPLHQQSPSVSESKTEPETRIPAHNQQVSADVISLLSHLSSSTNGARPCLERDNYTW